MRRSFGLTQALLVAVTVLASTSVSAQTLDAGFGIGGKVLTSFGGLGDGATAVAVQPDGKILAAGFASSGSLDTDFGENGRVTGSRFRPHAFI
jgi:hypothetical protein